MNNIKHLHELIAALTDAELKDAIRGLRAFDESAAPAKGIFRRVAKSLTDAGEGDSEAIGFTRVALLRAGAYRWAADLPDDSISTLLPLSARDYGELLAKLANQLEIYCGGEFDQGTTDLKNAFVKLDCACPYDRAEYPQTPLMEKYRAYLSALYPAERTSQNGPDEVNIDLTPSEFGEALAKLANELSVHCSGDEWEPSTAGLQLAFVTLDYMCPYGPWQYFETTLMKKYRGLLFEMYPTD